MAAFRLAVASALVAAIISAQSTGSAPAAGAMAIGACGAYGVAYDYERAAAASRAALGKCEGGCTVVPVSHRDRRPQCLHRARLCGGVAVGRGAEHGAAAVLPFRRQGLRHPRLGVRRQGLIAARARFLGVLKKSCAYQGLARKILFFSL
jgi:hypothetical protein